MPLDILSILYVSVSQLVNSLLNSSDFRTVCCAVSNLRKSEPNTKLTSAASTFTIPCVKATIPLVVDAMVKHIYLSFLFRIISATRLLRAKCKRRKEKIIASVETTWGDHNRHP